MKIRIYRRHYALNKLGSRFENFPPGWYVEVIKLSDAQQSNLISVMDFREFSNYDRIVIDLKWGFIRKQGYFLAKIPNLIIHETDACSNFAPFLGHYREFEYFYHRLGPFRLICTSLTVSDLFRSQGLDVAFVPKSFDSNFIQHVGLDRDIEFGFIGTLKNRMYKYRNRMLRAFSKQIPLYIREIKNKEEYREMLNRINYFISADVGLNEYMTKNFEAMECGCILVAFRQGKEEEALGLVDMENVVLYSTPEEAIEKIIYLQKNPLQAESLRIKGMNHVHCHFNVVKRDERLFRALEPDIRSHIDERPSLRKATDFFFS